MFFRGTLLIPHKISLVSSPRCYFYVLKSCDRLHILSVNRLSIYSGVSCEYYNLIMTNCYRLTLLPKFLPIFCREASCAIETRCIEVSEPPDPTTTRSRRSGKTKPELFIQESGKGTRIVTPRKNETLLIECFCEKVNRNAETKNLCNWFCCVKPNISRNEIMALAKAAGWLG